MLAAKCNYKSKMSEGKYFYQIEINKIPEMRISRKVGVLHIAFITLHRKGTI